MQDLVGDFIIDFFTSLMETEWNLTISGGFGGGGREKVDKLQKDSRILDILSVKKEAN